MTACDSGLETPLPMSSCLKQQMARSVALWPRSQARWLPGYCGRPVATWPPLPMCEVAEPLPGSSLRPAANAASCCALGNFSLEQERSSSLCPAEPVLWQLPFPGQTCCLSHFPWGDKPLLCWLGVTVLQPGPSQSFELSCGHVPAPSPIGICPTHGKDKGATDAIGSGLVLALTSLRSRHTRTAFMAGVCQTSRSLAFPLLLLPTWASSSTVELGLFNCRIQDQTSGPALSHLAQHTGI